MENVVGNGAPERLSVHSVKALVDSVEAFLFDCDGAKAKSFSIKLNCIAFEFPFTTLIYLFICFPFPSASGVIWKGDKLIEGVPQTLDMLRSKVKDLRIAFVFRFISSDFSCFLLFFFFGCVCVGFSSF